MAEFYKLPFKQVRNQYYAAISANLIMLGHGCALGWVSPTLPLLQSVDTPLESGPLTIEETSWVGAILSIGGILGNLFYGCLMERIGTKKTIATLALPQIMSWLCIALGYMADHIYISRFISGFSGGGVQVCVPLFVSEISDKSIRGKLGTFHMQSRHFGVLLAYVLGGWLHYQITPMVFVAVTSFFFISFFFLPNTPQYLLKRGKVEEAEKSLKFYRNHDEGCKEQKMAFKDEFERLQAIAKEAKQDHNLSLRDLCKKKAMKGLFVGVTLTFLNILSGCYTFITYSENIFQKSGTHLSPNTASIILAFVQILGTLCTAQLVDSAGRKLLLVISLTGCTFGLSSMAMYLYLDAHDMEMTGFKWIPVASLGFVILIANFGIVPLTMVCVVEVLPTKVRSFGVTLATITINSFAFIVVKSFPIMSEIIHMYGCMWIFAACCALGVLFVIFIMDETKGKLLDVVQNIDEKPEKKNVDSGC